MGAALAAVEAEQRAPAPGRVAGRQPVGTVSSPLLPGASELALRVEDVLETGPTRDRPRGPDRASRVRYQLTVHMPRRIPVLS